MARKKNNKPTCKSILREQVWKVVAVVRTVVGIIRLAIDIFTDF